MCTDNLPVASCLVDGRIIHPMKIDDFRPAPLSSLLFIIVSLNIVQERCAGGRQSRFVSYGWRGPLPWTRNRSTKSTHSDYKTKIHNNVILLCCYSQPRPCVSVFSANVRPLSMRQNVNNFKLRLFIKLKRVNRAHVTLHVPLEQMFITESYFRNR